MINNGIKSVAIIQSPDWNGGHDMGLYFDPDPEKDWYEDLGEFSYVEWRGHPIDLLKDMPTLDSHREPFHETPRDYEWEWWEDAGLQNIPHFEPEPEPDKEPEYVSYFYTDRWCGIVHNTVNIDGELLQLTWEDIAILLEQYYGEKVTCTSKCVGDWQDRNGSDDWATILPKPTTEEWWQGRLSIEECLIEPDDGDICQSGRQPRLLHKGAKIKAGQTRRTQKFNADPIMATISKALSALPKRVEKKFVVIETTGGSPSASITYEHEFSCRKEAEEYQSSFEAEQTAAEESYHDWWHCSSIEKHVTHWYTLPDGREMNFHAILREIERGRLHGLTLSF